MPLCAAVESMVVLLRAEGDPASLIPPARRAIWLLDPDAPLDGAAPVTEIVSGSVGEARVRALVLNGFACLALLLSGIGIYRVISYSVVQRTPDTGVRIALGARAADVLRHVVIEGLALSASGVLIGMAAAWLLTRMLSSFLFGVEPTDPATFAAVAAMLLLVAACASWLPARRASRVDPVRSLLR